MLIFPFCSVFFRGVGLSRRFSSACSLIRITHLSIYLEQIPYVNIAPSLCVIKNWHILFMLLFIIYHLVYAIRPPPTAVATSPSKRREKTSTVTTASSGCVFVRRTASESVLV